MRLPERKTPMRWKNSRTQCALIATVALVFCLLAASCSGNDSKKATESLNPSQQTLVVGSWGGAYQEAQRKAFFEPFMKETGIKIVETSTPDYGKFYEWQNAGSASVDVVDVETYF